MRTIFRAMALAVALLGWSTLPAQDTLVDQLVQACEQDLEKFCSQVTPGEGRLLHCVAAHEDKISGQCEYALYRAATVLEQMAAAIAYVAQQCETEIKTLCSNVMPGEGRIVSCLKDQGAKVGAACQKAIADTTGK